MSSVFTKARYYPVNYFWMLLKQNVSHQFKSKLPGEELLLFAAQH